MSPMQKAAYDAVRNACRNGVLTKPAECHRCGDQERFGRGGRSLLQAHHDDYSRPLSVEWICTKCHRKETRLPAGERNGNAVLRVRLVQAAILLHQEGFSCPDIADFFGVGHQSIYHAVAGRTWLTERAK